MSRRNTLLEIRERYPYVDIVRYENGYNVFIMTKYGEIKCTLNSLKREDKHSIRAAVNKTEYLNNYLKDKYPKLSKTYTILEYKSKNCIYVQTNEGIAIKRYYSMVTGEGIGINSYINNTELFKNNLAKKFPNYISHYKIIEYINSNSVIIKTKYGLCKTRSHSLLNKIIPNILSAIDKNSYLQDELKDRFNNEYDFSKVIYKNKDEKVKVICNKHGIFESKIKNLKYGRHGCAICCKENTWGWSRSKWIESYKGRNGFIYLCKFIGNNEIFYKIGITKLLKRRLKKFNLTDYRVEIINKFKDAPDLIWDLEKRLHKKFKEHSYIPKIKFGGYTECFNIEENILNHFNKL